MHPAIFPWRGMECFFSPVTARFSLKKLELPAIDFTMRIIPFLPL
jgi:hypothetical protein